MKLSDFIRRPADNRVTPARQATHLDRQAPAGMSGVDQDGSEMPALGSTLDVHTPSWRAAGSTPAASNPRPESSTPEQRAASHRTAGRPDNRRTDTAARGNSAGELGAEVLTEHPTNTLALADVHTKPAPARPRQGFTGADPARPATQRRPIFIRPFDKAIAEHPLVEKIDQPAPTARASWRLTDLDGPDVLPAPGGSTGTQTAGAGITRNTFRMMPKPWDATALNTGGPASNDQTPDPAWTAVQSQAARSWRAAP